MWSTLISYVICLSKSCPCPARPCPPLPFTTLPLTTLIFPHQTRHDLLFSAPFYSFHLNNRQLCCAAGFMTSYHRQPPTILTQRVAACLTDSLPDWHLCSCFTLTTRPALSLQSHIHTLFRFTLTLAFTPAFSLSYSSPHTHLSPHSQLHAHLHPYYYFCRCKDFQGAV